VPALDSKEHWPPPFFLTAKVSFRKSLLQKLFSTLFLSSTTSRASSIVVGRSRQRQVDSTREWPPGIAETSPYSKDLRKSKKSQRSLESSADGYLFLGDGT
jgi:hypothetical protein